MAADVVAFRALESAYRVRDRHAYHDLMAGEGRAGWVFDAAFARLGPDEAPFPPEE